VQMRVKVAVSASAKKYRQIPPNKNNEKQEHTLLQRKTHIHRRGENKDSRFVCSLDPARSQPTGHCHTSRLRPRGCDTVQETGQNALGKSIEIKMCRKSSLAQSDRGKAPSEGTDSTEQYVPWYLR
jgi:hypothetical protein